MISSYLTGFFLGLSLIVAIGSQNAFVLRQGILRQHVFYTALFCSISDSLLISIGILGISYLFSDFFYEFTNLIFSISALWLFAYAAIRIKSAFRSNAIIVKNHLKPTSLYSTIGVLSIFTFANPHVYLDTMILIGSVSQQFDGLSRFNFAAGACSASFLWFFLISYGARFIAPIMKKNLYWRVFDFFIAIIMILIGINLANQGNLF